MSRTPALMEYEQWRRLKDPHLQKYLPDPVPPEMECSVLVPMTVDKVGVNRQLEIVKHCRSVGCMPTSCINCRAVMPPSSILLQRQYAILGHRFQEQKAVGAGVIIQENESSLETTQDGEHSRPDTERKEASLVLHIDTQSI